MTTDCFRTQNSKIINVTDTGDSPCGSTSSGFSPCCRKGDQCLEDNICHFTRGGTGTSGYYIASCTDESGIDSSCLQTCNSNAEPDIVYIEADTLWHCCHTDPDTGATDCSNPTNYTFQAPAPENLAAFASSSTSASVSSITLSSPTSWTTLSSPTATDASSASTSSSTPDSNHGLSTGAKAGIGLGVALGVVCGVVLAKFIFSMRKRQRGQLDTSALDDRLKESQEKHNRIGVVEIQPPPGDQRALHELQGQSTNNELDPSRGAFHEMEVTR